MLVLLTRNRNNAETTEIPLSEFRTLLRNGDVVSVTIEDAELHGKLMRQVPLGPSLAPGLHFRTRLPQNMGSNWAFVQWVLDNSNGATVNTDSGGSLLMNIVVPLIPWVLIFGFIWFFVFRQLRGQAGRPQQPWPVVVVNPGATGGGGTPPPGTPPQPPAA
jgi:ATP-dependent Zn protease